MQLLTSGMSNIFKSKLKHCIIFFFYTRPYLLEDSLDASLSVNLPSPPALDLNKLGGRLRDSVTLYAQTDPYLVLHDLTVMPEVGRN